MSTFLGSTFSGIQIDETQLVLISGGNNAVKLLSANQLVDFGTYSLTNFGEMKANLDMGSHKIVNVTDPTSAQDAATKKYVDDKITDLVAGAPGALDTLNELAAALGDDANFATTLVNSLALKFNIADFNSTFATQYGLTDITSAAAQSGNYSANNHKFVDLAEPTNAQDAATKNYVDSQVGALNLAQIITASGHNKVVVSDSGDITTFTNDQTDVMVLDTTSLRPAVPIDMGSRKVVGLADATDKFEAMNLGQSLRFQWIQASLSAPLTSGFSSNYVVPFNTIASPYSLSTSVTSKLSNSSGVVTLQPGKYMVNMMVGAYYSSATSVPVRMTLKGSSAGDIPLLDVVTNRAGAFGVQSFTSASCVITVAAQENYTMVLNDVTYLQELDKNTKLLIQQIC